MPGGSQASQHDRKPLRTALDPISQPYFPSLNQSLHIAKEVLMGFQGSEHRRSESVRILSDRESIINGVAQAHASCSKLDAPKVPEQCRWSLESLSPTFSTVTIAPLADISSCRYHRSSGMVYIQLPRHSRGGRTAGAYVDGLHFGGRNVSVPHPRLPSDYAFFRTAQATEKDDQRWIGG